MSGNSRVGSTHRKANQISYESRVDLNTDLRNKEALERVVQEFKECLGDRTALAMDDAAFPIHGLLDMDIPLINYNVLDKVEDYAKRLRAWRWMNPWRVGAVITFVTPNTNEMEILHDFENQYAMKMAELLWDGRWEISRPNTGT
ncbi:unnamed protein product [Rhizoctonia solani]|uniref:Uncharacterized protein n=1 Tax=Rhizoctonia solani TaxID=456999 RepID=A0A8H3DGH9_9AGAM|nr:unnamed protein product [Rhizoctonia solani]